jgi:hypothetical protein
MNTTPNTMTGTIWRKCIEAVECRTLAQLGTTVGLFFLAGLASSFVADGGGAALAIMQWKNHLIPHAVLCYAAVFAAPRVWRVLCDSLRPAEEEGGTQTEAEAIPTNELLDYLFTVRTFKRDDVESRFAIPRYKYTALVQRMKAAGVLVHGVNNQTMLAPGMTREEAAGVLSGEGTQVRVVRPLPCPVFTRKQIADLPMETDAKPLAKPCATV